MVIDGGFFDKDRINYLNERNQLFYIGVPLFMNYAKEAIDKVTDIDKFSNMTSFVGLYATFLENETVYKLPRE